MWLRGLNNPRPWAFAVLEPSNTRRQPYLPASLSHCRTYSLDLEVGSWLLPSSSCRAHYRQSCLRSSLFVSPRTSAGISRPLGTRINSSLSPRPANTANNIRCRTAAHTLQHQATGCTGESAELYAGLLHRPNAANHQCDARCALNGSTCFLPQIVRHRANLVHLELAECPCDTLFALTQRATVCPSLRYLALTGDDV